MSGKAAQNSKEVIKNDLNNGRERAGLVKECMLQARVRLERGLVSEGLVGPSQEGGFSLSAQELAWLLKALDYKAEGSIEVGTMR